MNNREQLQQFDEHSLPNLDVVTLGALELCSAEELPEIATPFARPLVVGSGGAYVTGRMLFSDTNADFANESTYKTALASHTDIDGAVLISASGGKHADELAADLKRRGLPLMLLTNNQAAPAAKHIAPEHVFVFPRNREPYTYNTSTYLSMLLAREGIEAATILDFITDKIAPVLLRELGTYNNFTFIVPPEQALITELIRIKFEELFVPQVWGRAYTSEDIKHAKTVVPSADELFISLGVENTHYGAPQHRLQLPLPPGASQAACMAIAYYLIGRIQAAHPPYFKNNITNYVTTASEVFGERISVIVE